MFSGGPGADQILSGSRTTSGTLLTVPAGNTFTGNLQLTAAVAVAGTSAPTVSVSGTNAAPASGSIVARLNVTGLLASAAADSIDTEIVVKAPPGNEITLEFTAGASGASSATVNGWIFN